VGDAALALPEGHHPEAPRAHPLRGVEALEIFAERILNQTAKRDSGRRGGSLGSPEHVIVELNRGNCLIPRRKDPRSSKRTEMIIKMHHPGELSI
jgi:hypothetical protein